MGKDKGAGERAANQETRLLGKGIEFMRPFANTGIGQLSELRQGTSAGGLDDRLSEILNTDIFGSLTEERERAVQGQLGAGGLTRSGAGVEAMANVPTELALQLEQMLTGRSQGLANQGLGAAGGLANIFGQQGASKSSGTLADAQAGAAGIGQALGAVSSIFFSDIRLKENVVEIGSIGDLALYEWDWIPQTKGTIVEHGDTKGFIAQDVKEKYPEFVGEYAGWLFIDYDNLLNKLEDKYLH